MLTQPCHALKRSYCRQRWASSTSIARAHTTIWKPVLASVVVVSTVAAYFWPKSIGSDRASPSRFTTVAVSSNELATRDTKLLTLTVPLESLQHHGGASLVPIWSIFVKDDEIQVERPYTPLEGLDARGRMKFWIKKYPSGEVGRWLHSKKAGETVEIRGPVKTMEWREDDWDEVVMISGGTGITPIFQLLHHVFSCSKPTASATRYTLLHSSRTPADLPPAAILQPLTTYAATYSDRFTMHFFVDSLDSLKSGHKLHVGRIDEKAIKAFGLGQHIGSWWQTISSITRPETQKKRTLFIVCGPDPMINAIAGPFGKGFSQGPVGGILGRMGYSSGNVRKL